MRLRFAGVNFNNFWLVSKCLKNLILNETLKYNFIDWHQPKNGDFKNSNDLIKVNSLDERKWENVANPMAAFIIRNDD